MPHKDQAQRTEAQRKRRGTIEGRLKSLVSNAIGHSKPRGHEAPSVSWEDLKEIWEKQDGRCAYTGWPLDTQTGSLLVASLERVDNDVGYTKSNSILVCWAANRAKHRLNNAEFIELCRAVVLTADNKMGRDDS